MATEKRFEVRLADPGVFVFVDGVEAVYWDTTDAAHKCQGLEIARGLKVLYERGPDAFVEWSRNPITWDDWS